MGPSTRKPEPMIEASGVSVARHSRLLCQLEADLDLCPDLRSKLETALVSDCPLSARDGGFIRGGYNEELDRLRAHVAAAEELLAPDAALVLSYVLLDEPFAGLDPVASDVMAALLREEADRGVPVLFSSHQLDVVERLCDQVTIIDRGRVVTSGGIDDLRHERGRSHDRDQRGHLDERRPGRRQPLGPDPPARGGAPRVHRRGRAAQGDARGDRSFPEHLVWGEPGRCAGGLGSSRHSGGSPW